MVGGILLYLFFKPDLPAAVSQVPGAATELTPRQSSAKQPEMTLPEIHDEEVSARELFKSVKLSNTTTDALEEAVSLRTAETLYKDREYFKACYVFNRLRENLIVQDLADECLDNYLELKMALCLQRTQEQELMTSLFARALESRSPAVRALAYYNLAFLQMHNRQYLSARTSAYKALGLMETLRSVMPETVETDCYFLAAEALTRYLLKIHDRRDLLPGSLWSDQVAVHPISITDQEALREFLVQGIETLNTASVSPKVSYHPYRQPGAQWSAVCVKAPLEEVLWKYSSSARIKLTWAEADLSLRTRPITLYLPVTAGTYLAETAAGIAGLLWRYDGQTASLYDPESYTDFESHKKTLVGEAVAVWQRFLLRYRGDHRSPNAHYALGVMYTLADQIPTALGEYKLISAQYPHNPLAPYALLNSSELKTDLRDFEGARTDLRDLMIQYPEFRLVDKASLYLAEALVQNGRYEEADEIFQKVYQINLNSQIRCRASYGLGRCAYEQGDYPKAQQWLNRAIELTEASDDMRLGNALSLLGHVCMEQGQYEQAAMAFQAALDKRLSNEEYFEAVTALIGSRIRQQNYVEALEILEQIPETELNQQQACEVMLLRSQILRDIGLTESALSLLRRRIEFIAEADIRARLSVELARCYLETGDLAVAEKELSDAIYDLRDRAEIERAMVLLARIFYRRGRLDMAEELCRQMLAQKQENPQVRREVFLILGGVYRDQERYEQAALAYAGIPDGKEGLQP